ncbi:MAG: hypothetical protein ACI8V8_002151 [Chitinophagales bacterium]|jgi:hypothetical protein
MKNLSLIFFLFILGFSACKDDDCIEECEGPACPLSNGEYCLPNMINIDDECICPDEFVDFDGRCLDLFGDSYFDSIDYIMLEYLNCGCVENESIIFNFNVDLPSINGWYISNNSDQPLYFDSTIDGPPTIDNFYAHLYPYGRCNPEDTGFAQKPLYIHGSIASDTLYYDLFFYNSTDTCKGFKQAEARI